MKRITVKELFASPESCSGKEITVAGWCRAIRANNNFGFIDLNDGSTLPCLQVVFEAEKLGNYKEIAKQNVGAALTVCGILELTPEAPAVGTLLGQLSRQAESVTRLFYGIPQALK